MDGVNDGGGECVAAGPMSISRGRVDDPLACVNRIGSAPSCAMIRVFDRGKIQSISARELLGGGFSEVRWIDLIDPTPDETSAVESLSGIELPTRKEAQEIEISSRLYTDSRTLFMTATVMVRSDQPNSGTTPITFAYRSERLVTLRFDNPTPFRTFAARYERNPDAYDTPQRIFLGLFDQIVDRIADVLEFVAADLNDLSATIFMRASEPGVLNYTELLKRIGQNGTRTADVRESLVSLQRVHAFFTDACAKLGAEPVDEDWRITGKDVSALASHATFVSSKVAFFLDATLGRINSEQNAINSQQNKIIKLFSVLAVVLLPPTLVASIYGMNFQYMPELRWRWGYPLALGVMLLSSIVPYCIFKLKKWL